MRHIYDVVLIITILYFVRLIVFAIGLFVCRFIITALKRKFTKKIDTEHENKHNSNKKTLKETIKNAVRGFVRYMNVKTGHIRSNHVRNFIYRNFFLVRMAQCAMIRSGAVMRASHNLQISKGAIIGFNAILDATNGLRIGENANISEGVWIWTEQHNVNDEWFSCKGAGGPVVIGNRAWISSRVVILPGVTIGEGAVVAAGAVVTKNIEPFSIYGGIPAKKIGERNRDLKYEFAGNYLSLN